MSKIIEICGAPGSGKTTTYNALITQWRQEFYWSPTVYPLIKLDFSSLKKMRSTFLQIVTKGKDYNALNAAGDRFVAQFPDYMDQFWNSHFFNPDDYYSGVDLRFRNGNVYW